MVASGPLQLAGNFESRRFVFTAGNLSVIDIFDQNSYAGNLRQQFFNMAFMTHAAYDFAADARGYSWGLVGEFYYDNWAFRLGRFLTPKNPNDLPLDFRFFQFYGDQAELVHKHQFYGLPGAAKLLVYRNRENAGSWADAITAFQANPAQNATTCPGFNYGSDNVSAPDLCWARKPNIKMGIGLNLEQVLTEDIGIFFRGMYSDGKTEIYSYTSSDRSSAFGVSMTGLPWGRPQDGLGIGYAQSWISAQHAQYLRLGGIDGFIGDGYLTVKPEQAVDVYYKLHLLPSVWVSADYQHIANPGYNADRGASRYL
ncbi:MAG: carbohydrate porin [Methylococcales bacterium]